MFEISGRFLVGKGVAVQEAHVTSPLFVISTDSCLRFQYSNRGNIVDGLRLKVYKDGKLSENRLFGKGDAESRWYLGHSKKTIWMYSKPSHIWTTLLPN